MTLLRDYLRRIWSTIFVGCMLWCCTGYVQAEGACGMPAFSPSDAAAVYIWKDCGLNRWHLRAAAGGDYASVEGHLFTDGSVLNATPVLLGTADSLTANSTRIDFHLRTWGNNLDGIDLILAENSRLYLDITAATHDNLFNGLMKQRLDQFPARLGGAGRKLNLIVILSDDQRFDTLWAMPNLQEHLISRGVYFDNAVVSTPLCCPARASILSGGLYDKNTGVYTNEMPTGSFELFDDTVNLGTALQHAGYRTGLIGKVMNGYPVGYVMPGWNTLIANRGPGQDDWNSFTVTAGSSHDLPAAGTLTGPISQYITDYHRDRALEFIDQPSEQPFFLLISSFAPHAPATPAPQDIAKFSGFVYKGRGYSETDLSDKPLWMQNPAMGVSNKVPLWGFPAEQLRSLQALDRLITAIVSELTRLGKLDQTVIMYTSDNGFMWGEHGIWQKTHEYEESLRVPLVVRYPGIAPRVEHSQVAMDLDLPATALDIADSDFRTDGRSLAPLLYFPDTSWREWLLVNQYNTWTPSRIWAGIRTDRWKYVESASGDRQLYDLQLDPFELESRHNDPETTEIQQSLREILGREKGLAITSLYAPKPVLGQAYRFQLTAWGGTPPYTWRAEENPVLYLGKEKWRIKASQLPLPLKVNYVDCGQPQIHSATERGFFLWQDCGTDGWHVRATAGGTYGEYEGAIMSSADHVTVEPYQLNDADYLGMPAPDTLDFRFRVWGASQNGMDFVEAPATKTRMQVKPGPDSHVYLGANRFDVTGNIWPKTVSGPLPCGAPSFDPAVDSGVFVWLNCAAGIWHVRAAAGGGYKRYSGYIQSDAPLQALQQYNLNENDVFDVPDPARVNFVFQIWGNGVNGLDFQAGQGATLVVDVDRNGLPPGLSLDEATGVIQGVPVEAVSRTVRISATDRSERKIDGGPQKISMDLQLQVVAP